MEFTIPIQQFSTHHVRIGAISRAAKPMAPLSYHDGVNHFLSLTLLLPSLTIKSYDSTTGRLALSLTGHAGASAKIQALQELLISSTIQSQRVWFPSERPKESEEVRAGFQPFLDHTTLHLYCPVASAGPSSIQNDVQVYSKGAWVRGVTSPSVFVEGAHVRVAIRVQGISFHRHPVTGMWTGKFRVQHRILAMLFP
jgi:hypothetical protein